MTNYGELTSEELRRRGITTDGKGNVVINENKIDVCFDKNGTYYVLKREKKMARTNQKNTVKYHMRGKNVLIRKVKVEQVRGLFMPEASIEGCQFVIEEVAPEITDLKKGDIVFVKGTPGKDVGVLPNDHNLLVALEENVLLVMEPVPEDD